MTGTLPSGTVTFLLTDIEGSTEYWDRSPEEMSLAIRRHHEILHTAVREAGGALPKDQGEGDAVFASFAHASDAIACAIRIQRDIAAEAWPSSTPISVRIGLHTGEAELRDDNYFGASVSRCARVRGAGHGGQILISATTALVARRAMPDDAVLTDLGEHELRGLEDPERIYQLHAAGLRSEFAPLKTQSARPNNLRRSPTPLIGREGDLDALDALLEDGPRVVTLTGFGGIGKSRLALETAFGQFERFEDGVWWCGLESVRTAELATAEIRRVLEVRDTPGADALDGLVSYLRPRRVLLVLDNVEHVDGAAALVADLVALTEGLVVLATGREALRIRGEVEVPVEPLGVDAVDAAESIQDSPAVRLFVERARAVRPDFDPSPDTLAEVAGICRLLDGLPLAIELAAARTKLFAPAALAARLRDSVSVLGSGPRDLPTRQQGLEATVRWSVDLLEDAERETLSDFSVFSGGWSLDAAEAVCGSGGQVMDALASLIDKNLVQNQQGGPEPRFRLLNVIRSYAGAALADERRRDLEKAHVRWFRDLALRAADESRGPARAASYARLGEEHDNVRAALGAAVRYAWPEGVELAAAMSSFWSDRGHLSEGASWLEQVLAACAAADADVVAAQLGLVGIRAHQGDFGGAGDLARLAIATSQTLGDALLVARATSWLAALAVQVDDPTADEKLASALSMARNIADEELESDCLANMASLARQRGDLTDARRLLDDLLALDRRRGDPIMIASTVHLLGMIAYETDDLPDARARYIEALGLREELGDRAGAAETLTALGRVAEAEGDVSRGRESFVQALRSQQEIGDVIGAAETLCVLASLQISEGDVEAAVPGIQQALATAASSGIQRLEAWAARLMGEAELSRNAPDAAEQWLRRSIEAAVATGDRSAWTEATRILGPMLEKAGRGPEARELLTRMDRRLTALAEE